LALVETAQHLILKVLLEATPYLAQSHLLAVVVEQDIHRVQQVELTAVLEEAAGYQARQLETQVVPAGQAIPLLFLQAKEIMAVLLGKPTRFPVMLVAVAVAQVP
jgi:hypothetical protein